MFLHLSVILFTGACTHPLDRHPYWQWKVLFSHLLEEYLYGRYIYLQHVYLDTTKRGYPRQLFIVLLDNVMRASRVPVKPLNQTRVMRVPVPRIVANAEHTACGELKFTVIWGSADEENEYREMIMKIISLKMHAWNWSYWSPYHKMYSCHHFVSSAIDIAICKYFWYLYLKCKTENLSIGQNFYENISRMINMNIKPFRPKTYPD